MIPFKPTSEKTLAHQLLTFVKLASVLKEEQQKLIKLKNNRPQPKPDLIRWEELDRALRHEAQIAQVEARISKLYNKTEEYEKEIIQYVPKYLYHKSIEIKLYGEENEIRYTFMLKIISANELVVRVL